MSRTVQYEAPSDSTAEGHGATRGLPAHNPDRVHEVYRERRVLYPLSPRPTWYENLPTWVSISIFLHGLILLVMIVLLSSPETFGLASEDQADRATRDVAETTAVLGGRVTSLEQQLAVLRGAAPLQSGADAGQRLGLLEARVARLCAASNPPC